MTATNVSVMLVIIFSIFSNQILCLMSDLLCCSRHDVIAVGTMGPQLVSTKFILFFTIGNNVFAVLPINDSKSI